jgi:phosphomannomutase/phosphoglucomutase
VLWGDMLTVVLSRAVLKEQPGATIMGEVKCSKVLYDDVAKHGGNALMWRTGHSLIKAKMKETGTALAGEMSGHIFFKHRYYGFDDAAYAGGRLLEILSASDMSLDALCADIPHTYNTPEIRFDCAESIKFELVRRVTDMFKQGASEGDYRVIDIDGARVEWADGWGLVRCSNTQPLLVLRFEALSQERLDAIQALFEKEIVRIQRTLM